jgi:N-acetylglucosamine-6-phosphate deacetylase
VTHLFNAMPPLAARAPGVVGAALADSRLIAGLIVDGLHVNPVAVRAAFAAKGADAIALVTDAMPSVGTTSKSFRLMGATVTLSDGRLTTANGTLAGAHLDMASAVRNTIGNLGVSLPDAFRMASETPAAFLGLGDQLGRIAAGCRASLVLLDAALKVRSTWIDGVEEVVH